MFMKGYIHSVESLGTVDGPGVRFVVFFQGCPMRCQYCHNPDTWNLNVGKQMNVSELLQAYEKNRSFYKTGGITVTGGEPLMQIDFLIELFEAAKKEEIHTCLDTSGVTFNPESTDYMAKIDRLLAVTDLVMLDIKHINNEEHKKLTQHPNNQILSFAKYLDQKKIAIWIRHVVVPGITDKPEYLTELGHFIGQLSNVKALDVLPYHSMGKVKYEQIGIDYPLKDLEDLSKEDAVKARKLIIDGIREYRSSQQK